MPLSIERNYIMKRIYIENEFGVRIEDVVLLTDNGIETLSNATKEIIVIK